MIPTMATKAFVGVLVPLLGFFWLSAEKSVTVVIDGQPHVVSSHAATVAEMLDRADIHLEEADDVVPETDTPLADGMVVEIVRAREISVLIGDQVQTLVVTAVTVEDVLAELGGVGRRDVVRPSRLARVHDGMVVQVRKPVAVTVAMDGDTREVITDATSVAQVLAMLGARVDEDDRVEPALNSVPQPGMEIVVERVTVERETREVSVPFETVRRETDELPRGQEREVRAGAEGRAEVVEDVTFVDGVEEGRERISSETVREPVDRIVEVGTAVPAPAPRPTPQARQSAAPRPAASPSSQPSGRSQTGEASKYASRFEGQETANGETYDASAYTAAHRSLPFGTSVTVTNLANGKTVRVRINDRGPFVQGRIIDLSAAAFRSIAPQGAGVVDVKIEW